MYELKLVKTIKEMELWQAFINRIVDSQLVTIAHNPCLGNILADTFGYKSENYLIIKNGGIIGVLPGVSVGSKYVSMPHFSYGGPVFISEDFKNKQIIELLLKRNYEVRSFNKFSDFYNDEKVTCFINLPLTVDNQWKSFKSKLRSQINKGLNYDLEILDGGIELLSDFYSVYTQNMLRLGSPPLPRIFLQNILNQYKFGNANITVVKMNNIPVAAGLTLSYMGFNEVCLASSIQRFNKYNVNMVLYWELIKKSILEGNKIFSFGRASKGSNTLKFKLQWNPDVVPIYFNYAYPHTFNIKKMVLLSKIWRMQPLKSSILFSKTISKYLY